MERGRAKSRMAAQASDADRAAIADHLLINDGTLEQLQAHVSELFEKELNR